MEERSIGPISMDRGWHGARTMIAKQFNLGEVAKVKRRIVKRYRARCIR